MHVKKQTSFLDGGKRLATSTRLLESLENISNYVYFDIFDQF